MVEDRLEEEEGPVDNEEVLLLELLRVEPSVLLGAAVVDEEVWVTTLGSVEGIGLPSLVWSFTT